jgi:hypothetical protein
MTSSRLALLGDFADVIAHCAHFAGDFFLDAQLKGLFERNDQINSIASSNSLSSVSFTI